MRTRIALACFFASISFGQMMSTRLEGDGTSMTVTMKADPRLFGAAVTGAPYSAKQISEHVQTLADGTHITQQENSQTMYRDSEGRTRTERDLMMGGMLNGQSGQFTLVEIRDPVAGFYYVIDDQNKVAHRMAVEAPPAPRQRPPLSAEQQAALAKMRAANSMEKLGSDNIEGVAVEGTRITRTVPIGQQGNDRPLVTTTETWVSPELKTMILIKTSNPRYGDQTTRLTNISRAEQDPALFMPPAGYTVVDEKDSFTMTLKRQ